MDEREVAKLKRLAEENGKPSFAFAYREAPHHNNNSSTNTTGAVPIVPRVNAVHPSARRRVRHRQPRRSRASTSRRRKRSTSRPAPSPVVRLGHPHRMVTLRPQPLAAIVGVSTTISRATCRLSPQLASGNGKRARSFPVMDANPISVDPPWELLEVAFAGVSRAADARAARYDPQLNLYR